MATHLLSFGMLVFTSTLAAGGSARRTLRVVSEGVELGAQLEMGQIVVPQRRGLMLLMFVLGVAGFDWIDCSGGGRRFWLG